MVQSPLQRVLQYQMLIQNGPLMCESEIRDVFNLGLTVIVHLHQHWSLIRVVYLGRLWSRFHL